MKFFHLLLIFCFWLSVSSAQRRSAARPDSDPTSELDSANDRPLRRGRSRFVIASTEGTPQEERPTIRRVASRRRPVEATLERRAPQSNTKDNRRNYEVQELIDEGPIDTYRKVSKARVVTETKFEAQNIPPIPNALFQPSIAEETPSSSAETLPSPQSATNPDQNSTPSSGLESGNPAEVFRTENEILSSTRSVDSSTPLSPLSRRAPENRRDAVRGRSSGRNNRNQRVEESTTTSSASTRVRSRTRSNVRVAEVSTTATPSRLSTRFSRRRQENVETRTKGPSVFTSAEVQDLPSRTRSGRRIGPTLSSSTTNRKIDESTPEKIQLDIPPRRTQSRKSVDPAPTIPSRRSTESGRRPVPRGRSRSLNQPPIIDEQKLEVLPLFEVEAKTVRPRKKLPITSASRRRPSNYAEDSVQMSATENDVKVTSRVKPSTSRAPLVSRKQSVVVETRTETSFRRKKPVTSKPVVKESVVREVTEVTSKRTVTRKALPRTSFKKTDQSRGSRKNASDIKGNKSGKGGKSGLTSSEEDIEESDNYPEPFKALIQAKKQGVKESRPEEVRSTIEKVVTGSSTTAGTVIVSRSSEPTHHQIHDSENELSPLPKSTTSTTPMPIRSTKKRIPPSERPKLPTRKSKFTRSTTTQPAIIEPPGSYKEHRFHAKFNSKNAVEATPSPVKSSRAFSPKPPRGLYSSRKDKEGSVKTTRSPSIPTQLTPSSTKSKASTRFSSRYRGDSASRSTIRTSTNAPAYLPTIPTIYPPVAATQVRSGFRRDKDLGVEVISFDDPVNTIPSANLVSDEFASSTVSTSTHLTSPLVSLAQTKTEKPVSIIEQIINSITAISTEDPVSSTKFSSTLEPTKSSAILKLATKKATKLDKTDDLFTTRNPVATQITTEKPTTIIERILSSLSALNSTDNDLKSQVGTDFNTISSPPTTPMSTLPAQIGTSVNPLSVLGELDDEQILQKRTIGKLLAILNGLTSPAPPANLVVVTPKSASLTSSTTFYTPTTTTLYTSDNPSQNTISLNARFASETDTTPQSISTSSTSSSTTTENTPESTSISDAFTTGLPEAVSTTPSPKTTDLTNDIGVLPLFVDPSVTSQVTQSTEPSAVPTTTESFTATSTPPSTESIFSTETVFTFPSTIPALINFEVSPGSVSVFNANDLSSNAITPDDLAITISGRTNSVKETSTVPMSTSSGTSTENPSVGTTLPMSTTNAPTFTTTTPATTTSTSATSTSASPLPLSTVSSTTESADNSTQTPPSVDVSANTIDSTSPSVSNNQTVTDKPSTNSTVLSNRSGRLLADIVQDSVQNSIENNTTAGRDKDYFIFAILNNNTILRKRPDRFPNKETPFLLVGLYPNNTIVKRFPNGTLVPMEPVIRVSGFDTRENPPPLPEITSNQVTPDRGDRPDDNTNQRTVDQNTISPVEANALSISNSGGSNSVTTPMGAISSSTRDPSVGRALSSTAAPTTAPSTTSTTPATSATTRTTPETPSTTVNSISSTILPSSSSSSTTAQPSTTTPAVTLPTLTEILNGRTVQAFNSIINISDLTAKTLDVDPKTNRVLNYDQHMTNKERLIYRWRPVTSATYSFDYTQNNPTTTTTTVLPTILSNRLLDSMASTTNAPIITTGAPIMTTTGAPATTVPTTRASTRSPTTAVPLLVPPVTTRSFPTTTFFPTFLTTLFSTLQPRGITTPFTTTQAPTTTVRTTPPTTMIPKVEDLASASTTIRSVTTALPPTTTTTVPSTTTVMTTTTTVRTTTRPITTTSQIPFTSPQPNVIASSTKTPRQLSEQQIKDLQTITQLEKEQAAILKQLSFLANLNLGGAKPPKTTTTATTTDRNSLANRIIALAVDRQNDKEAETNRVPKKISPPTGNNPSIDDLVKQIQAQTPAPLSTTYGNSNDAIIAALLKQQGIGPTTPKKLEDIYSLTTTARPTTRKSRPPTTRAPGPIMQSLNWLLNALAPPTTRRPSKPKNKPKKEPIKDDDEDLTHQPTRITPVVTAAPHNAIDNLSQDEVKSLIKQLEDIQKNPNHNLDISQIKSLQNLINSKNGGTVQVEVTSHGSSGTTPITTFTSDIKLNEPVPTVRENQGRAVKSTTALPLSVSNSLFDDDVDDDDFGTTSSRPKISLPPVKLNPVPGVSEESGTRVRGQLLTAAVNVTRAISQFLGSALQGAASGFQTLVGSSSRMLGSLVRGSSSGSSG